MANLQDQFRLLIRIAYLSFCLPLIYVALSPNPAAFFPYHPVLMTVCYLAICTEALISARHMLSGSRSTNVFYHVVSQGIGVAFSLSALSIIYFDNESRGKPHFLSWHALVGLSTVTLNVIQFL